MQGAARVSVLVVAFFTTGVAQAAPAGPSPVAMEDVVAPPTAKAAEDQAGAPQAAPALRPGTQKRPADRYTPTIDKAMAEALEKELGIRVRGLRLSAAGLMLDFRYRVVDPAKARALLDPKNRPYLEDGKGARLGVPSSPKIGAMRSIARGTPRLDADYAILFGNPGGYLKKGSKVTLVFGDLKINNLTVE